LQAGKQTIFLMRQSRAARLALHFFKPFPWTDASPGLGVWSLLMKIGSCQSQAPNMVFSLLNPHASEPERGGNGQAKTYLGVQDDIPLA
jgi:hypothetical protein